jgi:hypothetical protein
MKKQQTSVHSMLGGRVDGPCVYSELDIDMSVHLLHALYCMQRLTGKAR